MNKQLVRKLIRQGVGYSSALIIVLGVVELALNGEDGMRDFLQGLVSCGVGYMSYYITDFIIPPELIKYKQRMRMTEFQKGVLLAADIFLILTYILLVIRQVFLFISSL